MFDYCEPCDQLIPLADVDNDENDYAICPDCYEQVYAGDVCVDNSEHFSCDRCQYPLYFGDEECNRCLKSFSYEYWEQLCNVYARARVRDTGQITMSEEAYHITLCCDSHVVECTCRNPFDWINLKDIPDDVKEEIYEYKSPCASCKFFYTPQCLPLRAWIKEFIQTGSMPGAIDLCKFYQVHEACAPSGGIVDEEYEHDSDLMYIAELGGYVSTIK